MRKKSVIVFLLITLISLISITEVFAQSDSNWFYNKPIARIIFDGLVHINREDVTAVTNQFLGKDFTDAVYSDLISKIYALEFFEDIIPEALPQDDNKKAVVLKFTVKELRVITKIEFRGNAHVKPSILKEAIGIKELEVLNEQKIPADVRALTEHYLNKGYTNVKVSYSLEKEEDGDVIVVFNISEGKSVIVTEINFEGNNLVASGVQLEAYSVEDNGKGVCFNVYVYNVQPGIVIDYKTGESWLEE